MTVNTLENDPFSIDAHKTVFQFKSPKADFYSADLNYISVFIVNFSYESIKVWNFRTPWSDVTNIPINFTTRYSCF